jgi:hypothetical protein
MAFGATIDCNARVTDDLRYPIGRFTPVAPTDDIRRDSIAELSALPRRMREAVAGLTHAQLDTAYRPGGWTVREVVHHVADSHLNAYVRFKLALTEEMPTVKPYDEAAWARLADSRLPVETSLTLLDALHARWVAVAAAITRPQYERGYRHPEHPDGPLSIDWLLQQYAWHSRHHVAHITSLRQREGW